MTVASKLVRPETQELLRLTVQRTERLSAHWMRVTFGEGDIDRFRPMGYDQWFRLFLPVGGDAALERVPAKANRMLGYLKFLRIPDGERPVMRNYTVRAHRPATADRGAEIDVDFVLHGSAADGTAGPASRWAETCAPGEHVAIIDEGLAFNPARGVRRVVLVADETGLPAVAGICASLPADAVGTVIVEVPTEEDALEFAHPAGVDVVWRVRGAHEAPGALALATLRDVPLPDGRFHAFLVGERSLPTGGRRFLTTERGVDKADVSFCGYWRVDQPASRSPRAVTDVATGGVDAAAGPSAKGAAA